MGALDVVQVLNSRLDSLVTYGARAVGAGDPASAVAMTLRGAGRSPGASAGWQVTVADPVEPDRWADRLAWWVGFTGDQDIHDEPDPEDLWLGHNPTVTSRVASLLERRLATALGGRLDTVRPVHVEGPGGSRFWTLSSEVFLLEGPAGRIVVYFGWSD